MRTILPILLAVSFFVSHRPLAQTGETPARYFQETGFTVRGAFLTFWETRGGEEIFGYPISSEFQDGQITGRRVQYFQRARLEWHPENPPAWQMQLGLLGSYLAPPQPVVLPSQIPPANQSERRYFPETGHTLSYAFLDYFNLHGGLDIFGYPISEILYEGNYFVQWFQRARMELHLEYPPESGLRMQLTRLGEIYMRVRSVWVTLENAAPDFAGSYPVTALQVSASVRLTAASAGERQTVVVIVRDQQGKLVDGAGAQITIYYADRPAEWLNLAPTSNQGVTQASFDLDQVTPGQLVIVHVSATFDKVWNSTQTSFWVWW